MSQRNIWNVANFGGSSHPRRPIELALLAAGAWAATACGQEFQIEVDASPMTANVLLQTFGYLPADAPQLVMLAVGNYLLTYPTAAGQPTAQFTVTPTGTVSYAPELEGILQGAGTSSLLVHGAAIELDCSQLTANVASSGVFGFVSPQVLNLGLLPGKHDLFYLTGVGTPQVQFTVETNGTVTYAPGLEGILEGNGTSSFVVNGAAIELDCSQLTANVASSGAFGFVSPQVLNLGLLPGEHDLFYLTGVGKPQVQFTVETNGTVTYAPGLEGILEGNGTSSFVVNGAAIELDCSQLTADVASSGTFGFVSPQVLNLGLLPGKHDLFYLTGVGTPQVQFTVETNGTVTYAPDLDGILLGSSTSTLLVNGVAVEIATGSANGGGYLAGGVCNCESCQVLGLLPGLHVFSRPDFTFAFNFEVTLAGIIEFDPMLDATVSGRGTARLRVLDTDGSLPSCNEPPIALCTFATITVDADETGTAQVTLDGTPSFDPDGESITHHWDVSDLSVTLGNPDGAVTSGSFPVGVTMATLTVADGRGGVATCDVTVTVEDNTPPEVMCTSSVGSLWPPNHKMRAVTLIVVGTDACLDPGTILPVFVTARSDELDNAPGDGDGDTTGDVNGQDGHASAVNVTGLFTFNPTIVPGGAWTATIQLRAERSGNGDGRAYTVDVTAFDSSLNVATTSCVIVVPHDQGGW